MTTRFRKSAFIWFYILTILSIAPFPTAADNGLKIQSQTKGTYQIPARIDNGWAVASLEHEGVEKENITKLIQDILEEKFKNIHSVLLVKNGKFVLEEYFHGYDGNTLHELRSATKSIGSVLTGIANERGYIKGSHEKIYPHFKAYESEKKWDPRVRDVSLKSLLTMTSGYACDDHGSNKFL